MKTIRINEIDLISYSEINLRKLFTKSNLDYVNFWQEYVIYCIHNDVNDKSYIGQAKDFFGRFLFDGELSHFNGYLDHRINEGGYILYKALDKYKSRSFTVHIIDEANSDQELNQKEKYWIEKLHTCIYDPVCWGYNMTWGGDDCSQLHSDKAWKSRAVKGNGDVAYMLHTPEARIKAEQTCISRYGMTSQDLMNLPEVASKAIRKSLDTRSKLYGDNGAGAMNTTEVWKAKALAWGGDVMGPCHTEEAINKRVASRVLGNILSYIDWLHSEGAPNNITFEIYWNWADGKWSDSNFLGHLKSILKYLEIMRLDHRWTAELDSIFSELELNKDKYLV
jgi:hypothetical protein